MRSIGGMPPMDATRAIRYTDGPSRRTAQPLRV